ncbi:MAG: acyltransferase [Bacteroidaceae bacterium]|nr:acyltransferase [Bacteroidaceae bacterium]
MSEPSTTKRIEYIDALRGFTMLLVVLQHVATFGWELPPNIPKIHVFLAQIRMPMFFFISGFVLYKASVTWNLQFVRSFLRLKFLVQIIPTIVFLALFCQFKGLSIIDSLFDAAKAGYWFTYTLFEYFLFYSILRFCFRNHLEDIAIIAAALFFYLINWPPIYNHFPFSEEYKELLGFCQWHYFCFFLIGTLVKKHFDAVQRWLDGKYLLTFSILFYFLVNFYDDMIPAVGLVRTPVGLLRTLAGMTILFAFFRTNQACFTKEHVMGRALQYTGRRTLDIYLLHYFLLPRGLGAAFPIFTEHPMPVIEFVCTFCIAVVIVALCLLVSNIIRLSPILAHYLFGVKVFPK